MSCRPSSVHLSIRNKCIVAKWCKIRPRWLIESHTLAFKWDTNHEPWMTLKGHNALSNANRVILWLNTNRKSHIGFQMTWKSFTLNDLEGEYCNKNCIDFRVSIRGKRFYCEKYFQNLCPIFSLFIYFVAIYIARLLESHSKARETFSQGPQTFSQDPFGKNFFEFF